MAMGLNLKYLAFKEMNHPLNLKIDPKQSIYNNPAFNKLKFKYMIWNAFSKIRIIPYNTLAAIIFKEMPSEVTIIDLKAQGYKCYATSKSIFITMLKGLFLP